MAFEPADAYRALRESPCPVHHVADHDPPFFTVSRFDDVTDVLRDSDRWRNGDGPGVFFQSGGVLGSADEPDHGRQRRVLRASFVPSAVARFEPRLHELCDELLDDLVPRGEGDFIESFAFPFPALAVGELLGVRAEDREMFRDLSSAVVAALTGGDIARYTVSKGLLGDYIDERLAERADQITFAGRTEGAAKDRPVDVLDTLLAARTDGRLSADEVRHLGHQLLVAGHETTTSLLGTMLFRLLERPELIAAVRADPELMPAVVEEALRFDSPVSGLFRTASTDSILHGVDVPARTKVQVLYGSANRDPDRFANPDEFRLDRPTEEVGHHVAFGWGIHYCIGAPFARLEARIALEHVLRRMHDIRIVGEPHRNRSFVLHGLTSLPLAWTPA
jgi:cytochrome P450